METLTQKSPRELLEEQEEMLKRQDRIRAEQQRIDQESAVRRKQREEAAKRTATEQELLEGGANGNEGTQPKKKDPDIKIEPTEQGTTIDLLDDQASQTRETDNVESREAQISDLGELDPFYDPVPDRDIDVETGDLETFVRDTVSNNGFLGYDEENDLPGTVTHDEAAALVVKEVVGGLIGTGISSALIATGFLAPLGIILLLFTNTPSSVKDSLKQWVNDKTGGAIDLTKLPNPGKAYVDFAKGSKPWLKQREERIKNSVGVLAKKNDLYKLCNNIRDIGRVLSQEEVKRAVEAFKTLIQKVKDGEIKDKDLAAKFQETFMGLGLNFGSRAGEVMQNLQGACEFLQSNVSGNNAIFSTDMDKVLDSFQSLITKEKTTETETPPTSNPKPDDKPKPAKINPLVSIKPSDSNDEDKPTPKPSQKESLESRRNAGKGTPVQHLT